LAMGLFFSISRSRTAPRQGGGFQQFHPVKGDEPPPAD
jgi:hypothetical protein